MKRYEELDERSQRWVEQQVVSAPEISAERFRELQRLLDTDDRGGGG